MSLFHANWMASDKHYRTAVKIFLENAKRSTLVTAVGLVDVNLETFKTIGNFAYSLYALFKKVNVN